MVSSGQSLHHPFLSKPRLVVFGTLKLLRTGSLLYGFNHNRSLKPRRRSASNRSRTRLPSVSTRLPSRCNSNTSLETLYKADIITRKARPQLFDVISGSGRGTTEDTGPRTSSPRSMCRGLPTARPTYTEAYHPYQPKFSPSRNRQTSISFETDSTLELPHERNHHVNIDFIFRKSGNMSNYGLGLLHNHPLAASLFWS